MTTATALLLAVLLPVPPAPPADLPGLAVYDLAALTDAQARQLAGHRLLYRVYLEGEPDGSAEEGWRYDCRADGAQLRTLWLPDGEDLAAVPATRSGGLLVVGATLHRIVHPPLTGDDGSSLPELVEYRLTRGAVVDRPER